MRHVVCVPEPAKTGWSKGSNLELAGPEHSIELEGDLAPRPGRERELGLVLRRDLWLLGACAKPERSRRVL